MFKLRAVIHCPGFLHGTSCTCLAAVSLAIYQCDGAKPRQCGIRHWLNCFYQSAPYRNGGYQSAGLGSQLALTTLGHHFVYRLRSEFIKRILDTHVERIEQLGSASLLAGLTSDVRNITIAFVRLPELVQGIILTIGSAAYLWMLSGKMLLVTAIWMAITIWGGFVLVARVYKHMATLRETEDKLYTDFQTVLEGRKELTLNRERAEYVFNNLYIPDAQEYRHHIIRADTFHLSAVNWSNIMMLGAIGLVFWMANSLGWADTNVAATYSLTLLFLRTPLLSAVGALPTLLTAQVAFNKLNKFALAPFKAEFPRPQAMANLSAANNRKIIANCFRQCLPMSGCLINCWGRRVNPLTRNWLRSGWRS